MRTVLSSRIRTTQLGAILATALLIGSAAPVAAKRPSPPPPAPSPSPTISLSIAPSGTLAPDGESAVVDVTVTCPDGWSWHHGYLYILKSDGTGGSGTFSAACMGTPQVARARAINGNRWTLGDWAVSAYVGIERNGQLVTASATRTVTLQPRVNAVVANQGQLTGTSGGGVAIAVAVACPRGAAGAQSSVTVGQDGTALGRAFFTPTCDGQTRSVLVSITASQGAFHTGGAVADASVVVTWDGGTFLGTDNRPVTLLESSTGDTTPPTTPAGLSANAFGDGETWLSWGASTDNATPSARIAYEVYLNGTFDQGIGGGSTQAILYAVLGKLNTIEVIAVDGAGNRSAPASVTVDLR